MSDFKSFYFVRTTSGKEITVKADSVRRTPNSLEFLRDDATVAEFFSACLEYVTTPAAL